MEVPDYSDYGFEDFLMDADFRAWVTNPTPETAAFWHRFVAAHPELQATMQEAAWAIEHFTIRPDTLSAESRQRIWQVLSQHYDQQHPSPLATDDVPVRRSPFWQRTRFRVAASLAGALLVAGLGWYSRYVPNRQTIETAYSETRYVTLPDGSTVTLNRNSSLTYTNDWTTDKPREVWVSGEAFFSVHRHAASTATAPIKPSDAFIVHTNLMNVEVLGTQFDVNTWRGKTRVVLNEGKVKLTRQGTTEMLLMAPGDLVEATSEKGFVKRQVNVASYDAWRDGLLRFDQTPIGDIISGLEDTYGWQVDIRRPGLANQTFTATVPADKPDLLLSLLTESFGLHIHRRGQIVTIE